MDDAPVPDASQPYRGVVLGVWLPVKTLT